MERDSLWVRGPVWDGCWMLCAVWLAPIVLWLSWGYDDPQASPLDVLYFGLTALFWIGHRIGSAYVAYGTAAYRPLVRAEPVRFVVVPALVTAACFAILMPADAALPWTRAERVVALAVIDYVFLTRHFVAQHFGVLALYRIRAGRGSCVRSRRLDRIFTVAVGGLLVVAADLAAGSVAYQDRWLAGSLTADLLASAADAIRAGAVLVLAAATLTMLAAEWRAPRRSAPRVLYVLGLAAMVALALRARSPFLFLVVWTAQHWIVATGLGSQVAAGPPMVAVAGRSYGLRALNARPWAIVLLLAIASTLLLPVFEVEASFDGGGVYYGDWIFGSLAAALRTSAWVPALLALGFASGFVHYLLDRAVYRFSDPNVRTAAHALLHAHASPRAVPPEQKAVRGIARERPSDIRASHSFVATATRR